MRSNQSSDAYNELFERVEILRKKNSKLEGARDQIIGELRQLGYKTEKSADTWVSKAGKKIEELNELIKKEAGRVRDQLDEYDREDEE